MGGAVSAGADNDELIDNLLEADYIKSVAVERVFRAVDRAIYFTAEFKERAYRDIAWKCGNLHISAPCIYSKVMENLKLAPGMSFLNLGSGTGYLSTMAGLILGAYGINHGIEIHEDVYQYATLKLEEFMNESSAIDEYEFCEPKFVNGNCLNLGGAARQYDRVYCSAACPENHESYMKSLIKVGGILVIPINDQLLQICRTSDSNWESKSVLPVSFATLISGLTSDCNEPLKMPEMNPLSLQDICRFVIRSILRRNIDIEHPELKRKRVPRKRVKKRTFGELVMPIFHSNSDDDEDIVTIQAGRPIIGWSQILSSVPLSTIETRRTSENSRSSSTSQSGNENMMDEDSNFGIESGSSSDIIFDEMSESDFEELQNMLAMSESSTVTSESDSEERQRLQSETQASGVKQKNRRKLKQEKIDSGIMEDIENEEAEEEDGGSDSEREEMRVAEEKPADRYPFLKVTDSDTDTESCDNTLKEKTEKKESVEEPSTEPTSLADYSQSIDSPPPEENPEQKPPNAKVATYTYTTYMKRKIKRLPLPMTLKSFINLNRKL